MTEDLQKKLLAAVAFVRAAFPHAVPILAELDVRFDDRVETACVCPSGRMLVGPSFAEGLSVKHLAFVVAHELYHLLYGVFDRFDEATPPDRRWLINVAHDFLVNEMVRETFLAYGGPEFVPPVGLFWSDYAPVYDVILGDEQPALSSFTLESLVLEVERLRNYLSREDMFETLRQPSDTPWPASDGGGVEVAGSASDGFSQGAFDGLSSADFPPGEDAGTATSVPEDSASSPSGQDAAAEKAQELSDLLNRGRIPELVTAELERELFPDEPEVARRNKRERLGDIRAGQAVRAELDSLLGTAGRGDGAGAGDALVAALEGRYATPWEEVLQKWFDDSAPPVRSWAHASRRAGGRTDVVLPGRRKDGYMINILLDTSGSMTEILPAALGMVQSFGKSSGVRCARIVQCDSDVAGDEMVDIEDLASYEIKWTDGGGMDPPGLLLFAEDPAVESVLVITDGYIDIPPREAVPYDVLWWVLCENGDTDHFHPDYGRVVGVSTEDLIS